MRLIRITEIAGTENGYAILTMSMALAATEVL